MTDSATACKPNPYRSTGWADAFLSVYDEQKLMEAERQQPADPRTSFQRVSDQHAVANRMTNGLVWTGGYFSGQYYKPAFEYVGLKSDENPLFKLFITKTNRAFAGLQSGRDKDVVEDATEKLLALDEPYITVNGDMRGVIRIDLDCVFDSIEHMRMAVSACLSEHAGIPAMPNFAVSHISATNKVIRPHLVWLLENSVCFTAAGRAAPRTLFSQVEKGLCAALVELGADPGGLSNSGRLKNPVSPFWHTEVIAQAPYHLDQLTCSVDISVSEQSLTKKVMASAVPDGLASANGETLTSNSFFNVLRSYAFNQVRLFKSENKEFSDFAEAIESYALSIAAAEQKTRKLACNVSGRVAAWVWQKYDPSKAQKARQQRGLLADEVKGLNLQQRQALGGKSTASRRRKASLMACRNVYSALISQDIKPTQKAVAIGAGVSERTVRSYWSALTS
ncbi:replication initiation protein [Thalassospira povalilytica]|uniref:replication initiation protein n=1 Tax=Thalassospira povalilytica TaxID=732237 RepID=UPI001D188D20|nr:replication initiation protein [Thalassospira povalilytica]MCC4240926.1 replication initiation protein [Thalassospira povalilytica]